MTDQEIASLAARLGLQESCAAYPDLFKDIAGRILQPLAPLPAGWRPTLEPSTVFVAARTDK